MPSPLGRHPATATINGVQDTTTFDPAGNLTSFTGTTLTYQNCDIPDLD